jgi:hypothetical protein
MESTTCAVRDNDRDVCVPDGLAPVPGNIKLQMPGLASMLQYLAEQLGRESVQLQLKASIDLRRAFDADDYAGVNQVYRRGNGWIYWPENGFLVGVPEDAMREFAARHRRAA